MNKELYFDVASDEWAAGLYRLTDPEGRQSFYYHHSASDLETGKVKNLESYYSGFTDFWKVFSSDPLWYCYHPLYIHPEQRAFIKRQLGAADQELVEEKWRELYARQWNKALNGPAQHYMPRSGK